MQKLDGKTINIGTLFSQENFFRIPEYQRPFSWEVDQFDDLIDDVLSANRKQKYFLGTIVLHHRSDEGIQDVVDGQQRLTSLMILFACLRDKVQGQDFKSQIQAKLVQPRNVVDGIPEKVRLEVRERKIFDEIVLKEGGTLVDRSKLDIPEPEWRYVKAVDVFSSKLKKLNGAGIQELITFLSQQCQVIYLGTSTFDDAFRLFTIVNDRGKQLRRIDVLKSINIAPEVVGSDTVRKRLAQQWEELEKELGEQDFESVFRHVRLILLRDKPQADLLKEFEKRVFVKGLVSRGEAFLTMMFDYIKLYRQVFQYRDILSSNSELDAKYSSLMYIMDSEFKASEWRACVLSFVEKFRSEFLYKFLLKIEKVFLDHWVNAVRKDERYSAYSKILTSIVNAKSASEVIDSIEYNEESIRNAVLRKNMYGATYCKYILLRLELSASELTAVREFKAKSVEHVLPQTPDKNGYWSRMHNYELVSEYVHSVGNLVLLSKGKNSAAKNYDFDNKKEVYLKNRVSDYPRSIQVLGFNEWTREIIEERSSLAPDLLLMDP